MGISKKNKQDIKDFIKSLDIKSVLTGLVLGYLLGLIL